MNASTLLDLAPALLTGTTALLACGTVAVACTRSPSATQRLAELAVLAACLFVPLALIPIPRLSVDGVVHGLRSDLGSRTDTPVPAQGVLLLAPPGAAIPGAPPTPAVAAADPSDPLRPVPASPPSGLLLLLYGIGGALVSAWLGLGAWTLQRATRACRDGTAEIRSLLDGDPALRGVRVWFSPEPCRAFSFGVLRPGIVVPERLLAETRRDELRHVLRHELVHVTRRDALHQLPFLAALVVLWFHPLVWWLRRRARFAAELIADDGAAQRSDKTTYARTMIRLAGDERDRHAPPACATTALRSESDFYRRMSMLLARKQTLASRCSRTRNRAHVACTSVVFVAVSALWGTPPAASQDRGGDPAAIQTPRPAQDAKRLLREIDRLRVRVETLRRRLADAGVTGRLPDNEKPPRARAEPPAEPGSESPAPVPRPHRAVVVRKGDSLASLIRKHAPGATVHEVQRLNPNLHPRRLAPGRRILLPVPVARPEADPVQPESATPPRTAPPAPDTSNVLLPAIATRPALVHSHDVLDLVARAIDCERDLKTLENELSRSSRLADKDYVSRGEVRRTEHALRAARKKRDVIRQLIEAEIRASEMELAGLHSRRDRKRNPAATEATAIRLRARIEILKTGL